MNRSNSILRTVAFVAFASFAAVPPLAAGTFTVTSTADSGTNTLRWAITQANGSAGPHQILFALPGSGVRVIALQSPLPGIHRSMVINAASQPGWFGSPLVRLDGQNDPDIFFGFDINESWVTIRGFELVRFTGSPIRVFASDVTVRGNEIGTDGTTAMPNGGSGVSCQAGTDFVLGGTAAGDMNVISGNAGSGVVINEGCWGATIVGNRIGTNRVGTTAIGNTMSGLRISGPGTIVGGASDAKRNLISGNAENGISVYSTATGLTVQGNRIGTNETGTAALANKSFGLRLMAPNAALGGANAGEGNLISGNTSTGIYVDSSAAGGAILGNRIGTDVAGNAALPNGGGGVRVYAPGFAIGGAAAGAGNLVSGNGGGGISVSESAAGAVVRGNRIGTNAAGSDALPNQGLGIRLAAPSVTIGGANAGEGNLISGNGSAGIYVDPSATGGTIRGNRIGTNAAGGAAIPNSGGIRLQAPDFTIGGAAPGQGNLVSGNGFDGISLEDGSSAVVQGNLVGTNASGSSEIPNAGYGVRITGGHGGTIGGAAPGQGNLISGNGRGLSLEFDADDYVVQGNTIGPDATRTFSLTNNGSGIQVDADGNLIGGNGPGEGNVISGNRYYGIVLGSGASGNRIEGNWIGTTPSNLMLGNTYCGIVVDQAFGNAIGGTAPGAGNTIAHNGYLGVLVWHGEGNAILGNSIHDNELLGIDLEPQGPVPNDAFDGDLGANRGQNFPVLTSAMAGSGIEIEGLLDSKPNTAYRVELFSNDVFDPTGVGEGKWYLGHVDATTDDTGHATFSTALPGAGADSFVTATATDPSGNTSEHSPAIAVGQPQPGQLQIWRDLLLSYEGTPGLEVTVVRSHGAAGSITTDVDTLDGTAFAPGDYGAVATSLTFGPGEVMKSVFVPIVTDGSPEDDEDWALALSNPSPGAVLGAQPAVPALLFDATLDWPIYSIGDAQIVEGDGGTKQLVFTVTLSPTDHDVPIKWWTDAASATAGDDYVAEEGQFVFHPGEPSKSFAVTVLGDTATEDDEIVFVRISTTQGTHAVVWNGTGTGSILDDDGGSSDLLFADDFESGATADWSDAVGAP